MNLHIFDAVRNGTLKPDKLHKDFKVPWQMERCFDWTIDKFVVEMDLINACMFRDGRGCFPGTYTRLQRQGVGVIMSDTTAEAEDHREAIEEARGNVLVHGLGLGCYLQCILKKEEVRHVDVVEIDETLLGMMYKYFDDERVTFHHADAFTKKWEKGEKWDVVWHDIWPTICSDNLQEMTALKRKFGRRCKWQGCWGEEYSRYLRSH